MTPEAPFLSPFEGTARLAKFPPPPGPPYRNPGNNAKITEGLFYERVVALPDDRLSWAPVFSLNDPKPGLICCRTSFVHLGDPTGYKWAMLYLKDWEHWKKLVKCKWFAEALEGWRDELEIKIQSEAIEAIREASRGEDAKALAAARYLANREWKKTPRGRPTRADIQAETRKMAQEQSQEQDDAARIGLHLVERN